MKNVLIMADARREYFAEAEKVLKEKEIDIVYGDPSKVSEAELIFQAQKMSAVIAGSETWSQKVLESCRDLKCIVRCGTGYDGIDIKAASQRGILIANTPGLNTYAVAEMALAMILCLKRRIKDYDKKLREGEWEGLHVNELRRKTVGLLGLGGVGRQLAKLLQPFQCSILAYDIFQDRDTASQLGVRYTDFETLIKQSDVLSIHLPLNENTKHLICRETLKLMKPECILINTSRGGLIDTEALAEALEKGWIMAAGLDVYEQEPMPQDYLLKKYSNLVLSPHAASATEEATCMMISQSIKEIIQFYETGRPENLLNGGDVSL